MSYVENMNVRVFANDLLIECWRRGGMSLRAVARETGITSSTLTRLTRYTGAPRIGSFLVLCEWMNVDPYAYVEQLDGQRERVSP